MKLNDPSRTEELHSNEPKISFRIISTALIALFTSLGRTLKNVLKIAVETF